MLISMMSGYYTLFPIRVVQKNKTPPPSPSSEHTGHGLCFYLSGLPLRRTSNGHDFLNKPLISILWLFYGNQSQPKYSIPPATLTSAPYFTHPQTHFRSLFLLALKLSSRIVLFFFVFSLVFEQWVRFNGQDGLPTFMRLFLFLFFSFPFLS